MPFMVLLPLHPTRRKKQKCVSQLCFVSTLNPFCIFETFIAIRFSNKSSNYMARKSFYALLFYWYVCSKKKKE